jgi:hypothetical protein
MEIQIIGRSSSHFTRVSRNAQELLWYSMAAQVQLAIGTMVARLPADSVFFVKQSGRRGYPNPSRRSPLALAINGGTR